MSIVTQEVQRFLDLSSKAEAKVRSLIRRETGRGIDDHDVDVHDARAATPPIRTVRIPACDSHDGFASRLVTLIWLCPACGGPRGEPYDGVSFDGSRRLNVHQWANRCGHVDRYDAVRREADAQQDGVPA